MTKGLELYGYSDEFGLVFVSSEGIKSLLDSFAYDVRRRSCV